MAGRAANRLLERDGELSDFDAMVASALVGTGGVALLEGEPGIGKTVLLEKVCAHAAAAGLVALTARGGELEREFAWGVVHQLFDQKLASMPPERRAAAFADSAALARPAFGLGSSVAEAGQASFSILHGLYWLTVNLTQQTPMLLAIDDLHWADRPSLRYVLHLAPRILELPILLVVTARPAWSEPTTDNDLLARLGAEPACQSLQLTPLSRAACADLVRTRLSEDAEDAFCLACYEMSRGNPFLIGALIDSLIATGAQPTSDGAAHVRRLTPSAVSRNVLVRLATLPPSARSLARAVAVLGARSEFRLVWRLARLEADEAAEIAGVLVRAKILQGGEVMEFVHPLVRDAVYTDLSAVERSRWHQRAIDLLVADGAPAERLAPHLLASFPDGNQLTVALLREAAAQTRGNGAPEVAESCLRRALAEPPSNATRVEVLFELGQIEKMQDPAAALNNLTEALVQSPPGDGQAAIALALGEALTLGGRLGDAIRVFGRGLEQLSPGPSELRASLEAGLFAAARWEPSAQDLRRRTMNDLRARAASGEWLDPRLHCQLAIEVAAAGVDREAATRHARAALAAADQLTSSASAVPEAALVLTFADLADEAWAITKAWLAPAQRLGWPLGVATASTSAALTALHRGAISEAIASARGAIVPGAEIRLAPITVAFLVEALIERGDLELARRELSERHLDDELQQAWATTPLLLARGRLHAAAGDHRQAIADLRATGKRANAWGVLNPAMMPWRSSIAVSLAAVGERAEAVQIATEEIELARRWGTARAIGVALHGAGMAHGHNEGLELLRQSVIVLEGSSAPVELARALTDLGVTLRRFGARTRAREPLRRALDLAHRCGALALANRAREELVVAGARPRRDALRGRDALTASELRVSELAAQGRTNNQIAQSLFVTARTVETHLTSVYAKLGITSRRELLEALDTTSAKPLHEPGRVSRRVRIEDDPSSGQENLQRCHEDGSTHRS
jgi:DNA-binding CsgD family transcriptional regulator